MIPAVPGISRPGLYQSRESHLALVAICLAAILPYISTVDDYFARDDFGVVRLLSSKPWTSFPRWFASSWMDDIWGYLPDEVRPFPALSYQITALWGAVSPVGHHLLNILLHAANGVLVFAIAREAAGLSLGPAGFAGLVFVLLPVHTESVAWITGRVDSLPAFFYLASFLAYVRWRASSSRAAYGLALTWFFMALFSKQTTITMVVTLVMYDVLVRGTGMRLSWLGIRPYVPFVLMTAGYLCLRYALFGEIVRERTLHTAGLEYFAELVGRHLTHVVAGRVDGRLGVVLPVLAVTAVPLLLRQGRPEMRGRRLRMFLYFGPVWWLIGVAPMVVAGYESPRHVYLAAVGWAVGLGLAAEALGTGSGRLRRSVSVALAMAVLGFYAARLHGAVGVYNFLTLVSQRAVRGVTVETRSANPGTLLIVGVPAPSWEWALPFAVQPPFARTDVTQRVFLVSPRALHCCRSQWFEDTKRTLQAWADGPSPGQVVVLRWDERTGAVSRATAAENRAILIVAKALRAVDNPDALDMNIQRIVAQLAVR